MRQMEGGCPAPPIDHLQQRQADANAEPEEYIFDRKKGNPGPTAKPYIVANEETPTPMRSWTIAESTEAEAQQAPEPEVTVVREPLSEADQIVETAMQEIKEYFPELMEYWLRNVTRMRMIEDKWNLERTVSYIFDNENIAPRKSPTIQVSSSDENIGAQREALFNHKHEITEGYAFFAEIKLNEMFPRLSTESIRRVFVDFKRHFMPTAISIAEGLEDYFEGERKSWSDFDRLEYFWLRIKRDGGVFRYAMQVVTGMKCWLKKKKGRRLGFPRVLAQELTISETWLERMRQNRLTKKLKRQKEERYVQQVKEAKLRGETSECVVCGEDYRTKEDAVHCTAGHEFCLRCLRSVCWEMIAGQVQMSLNGELNCLNGQCPGKFTFATIEQTVEPERLRQIEEIHIGNIINAAKLENLVKCSSCHYVAVVEVPVEVDKVFRCQNPQCGRQVCRLCEETWKGHEGRGCRPKEMNDEQLARLKFEDAMTTILTRQCAKCKATLVKDTGCNNVHCRCGATICYVCRAPGIGYDHFCKHPYGRGQKKCDRCTACPLYGNVAQHDEEQLQKLRLKFELERLAKLQDTGASSAQSAAPKTPSAASTQQAPPAGDPGAAFQRQFG